MTFPRYGKIISIYDIYIFVPYIFVGIMTYIFVPNHQPDYIYIS